MMTEANQLEQLILDTLTELGEVTPAQLGKEARIGPAALFPALADLEASGRISRRVESHYPNRAFYSLPKGV